MGEEHTPIPWRLGRPHKVGLEHGEWDEEVILGPNGESVLFPGDIGGFPKDADAEFVIRAVNSFSKAEKLANAVAFYLIATDAREKPANLRAIHEAAEHMQKSLEEYHNSLEASPGPGGRV